MGNNFTYQTTPSPVVVSEPFAMTITDEFNLVNPIYGYILKLGTEITLYLFSSSTTNSIEFTNLTYSTFGSNIPFILYEDPTVPKDIKMQTIKKFIDCMLPTFFMRCVDYFEKEKLTRIKEAVKFSLEEFKRFQLEKICGKIK